MNLSALFIKRPVTTTLLMLGILVFGGLAYQVLPVADLPSVDFPSIRVQASLPGASPETMAASVALPLEKQFTSIAGVTSINSTSTQGGTDITHSVRHQQEHRRRRPGRPVDDRPRLTAAPAGDAVAALLSEGQPGGSVDLLHRPAVVDAVARGAR